MKRTNIVAVSLATILVIAAAVLGHLAWNKVLDRVDRFGCED